MANHGIADPYWYEWYVGLNHVVNMLNPDNGISYVIFQSDIYDTIDDVVVGYNDGNQEICYQVKHEIGDTKRTTLTFNKLIELTKTKNDSEKASLIGAIANGWREAELTTRVNIVPVLYTNKSTGVNRQKRKYGEIEYQALPLMDFMKDIQSIISQEDDIRKIEDLIKEKSLEFQWYEFRDSVGIDLDCVLQFIKAFQLRTNEGSLDELEENMKATLQTNFSCTTEISNILFKNLVANLRIWTTTRRKKIKVELEDVFTALSINNDVENGQHKLPHPSPFFDSRKTFCTNLVNELRTNNNPIAFISGEPGCGKTSLISYLQSEYDIFSARYHTFKPISPEQKFYNNDDGLCSQEALWNDLLIQLRGYFRGELAKFNIPIINSLCTVEKMRSEVLRLSKLIYEKTNKKTIICIDGIDHAARSNKDITFLSSLYLPSEVHEGVCIVLVGQPADMYDKYPNWINHNSTDISHYEIPPLNIEDIKQLILEKVQKYNFSVNILAKLLFDKTKGNNLSVVFAIEEAKYCNNLEELREILDEKHINGDVNHYYEFIWNHVKKILIDMNLGFPFPDIVVASAIILLNGKLNAGVLSSAINIKLSEDDWTALFDSLHPLIQKSGDKTAYGLFHNDFRVYLMSIINNQGSKYKSVAYQLSQYYEKQESSIERSVNLIPLLISADRKDLIAKIFDTKFMVSSLAEGISKGKLKDFVELAYESACQSRNWELYHRVYLAICTLKQHFRYFEYYDREYKCIDNLHTKELQLCEIKIATLKHENIKEYEETLIFCLDLFKYKDNISFERAKSIFILWMEDLTPLSFIRKLEEDQKVSNEIWNSNIISNILKTWGEVAATLGIKHASFENEVEYSTNERNGVIEFNDAYFNYLFESNEVEKSTHVARKGGVSYQCIREKLQVILLNNVAEEFKDILEIMSKDETDINSKYLAVVGLIDCEEEFNIDNLILQFSEQFTYISDDSSFSIVLWAIIKGYQKYNTDIAIIVSEVYKLLESIERETHDLDYLKLLIRHGVILGQAKRKRTSTENGSFRKIMLTTYKDFFIGDLRSIRTYNFKEAFKVLLFLSLNGRWYNHFIDENNLEVLARKHLFEKNQLGMYYKTMILDHFVENDNLEVVKDYIQELYGIDGERIFQTKDFYDVHNHFMKYGNIVFNDMMMEVSNKIKWDVVGHIDDKEYALMPLLDYYKKSDPEEWRARGIQLNKLSYIVGLKGSDSTSYEIQKELAKSAASCGFKDVWELLQENEDFHFSLDLLYIQLFLLIDRAETLEDILSLWYLGCGILSWYNHGDRIGIQKLFDTCIQKSEDIGIDNFIGLLKEQESYYTIATNNIKEHTWQKSDEHTERWREEVAVIKARLSSLDDYQVMKVIKFESFDSHKWTILEFVWNNILKRGSMSQKIASEFLEIVISRLENYSWNNSGSVGIIQELIRFLGKDVGWRLAEYVYGSIGENDHYRTCSDNMNSILQWVSQETSVQKTFFYLELESQYAWLTGCGIIMTEVNYYENLQSNLPSPENLLQFSLNTLIEQFETRNAHRIEIACQGIHLLCQRYSEAFSYISESWVFYNTNQKEFIIKLSERWAQEDIQGFNNLIPIIQDEYSKSNELDNVIQLYLILKNYYISDNEQIIYYHAEPDKYTLPTNVPPYFDKSNVKSMIKRFLSVMGECSFMTDDDNILYYLQNNYQQKDRILMKEISSRSGDSLLFHAKDIREGTKILYGEEKKGRWADVPLSIKAQSLLQCDDAWIISNVPSISINKCWYIEDILKENWKKQQLTQCRSELEKIMLDGIDESKVVIGACLWYPIDHNDGIMLTHTAKLISNRILIKNMDITPTLNPGSILINEDELFEIEYEDINDNGVCLVNSIVGSSSIVYGNCMIYPSEFIRKSIKLKPVNTNPLIWHDDFDNNVMCFERISNPFRESTSENYFRQPLLSRWVCDKSIINNYAKDNHLTLYATSKLDPLPTIG